MDDLTSTLLFLQSKVEDSEAQSIKIDAQLTIGNSIVKFNAIVPTKQIQIQQRLTDLKFARLDRQLIQPKPNAQLSNEDLKLNSLIVRLNTQRSWSIRDLYFLDIPSRKYYLLLSHGFLTAEANSSPVKIMTDSIISMLKDMQNPKIKRCLKTHSRVVRSIPETIKMAKDGLNRELKNRDTVSRILLSSILGVPIATLGTWIERYAKVKALPRLSQKDKIYYPIEEVKRFIKLYVPEFEFEF